MMVDFARNGAREHFRKVLVAISAVAAALPSCGQAQDTQQNKAAASAPTPSFGNVAKDIISPDAPAFTALGVTSSDIAHPETLKKLGIAVLNGLDPAGNAQSGFALQFSPARLFAPAWVDYDSYAQDSGVRLAARFEIATALTKGSDKDKSSKATIGFVWRLIDTTDPYADKLLNTCLNDAFRAANAPAAIANPNKPPAMIRPVAAEKPDEAAIRRSAQEAFDKEAAKCAKPAAERATKGMTLQVGFAPIFVSETGRTGDFKSRGFAASGLFSLGLGSILGASPAEMKADNRFILGVTYRRREVVADPAIEGAFLRRNRLSIGGRLLFGSFDGVIVGAEAAYQHARYSNAGIDDYATYAATADIKITSKLWLGASIGGASGRRLGGGDISAGMKFKWSFFDAPSIGQ